MPHDEDLEELEKDITGGAILLERINRNLIALEIIGAETDDQRAEIAAQKKDRARVEAKQERLIRARNFLKEHPLGNESGSVSEE